MAKKNILLLAVIIPMYNEAAGAKKCIFEVLKILTKFSFSHMIIINDGSTDGTQKILAQQEKLFKKKLTIVTHQKNKGYGAALQTGIRTAKKLNAKYLLFMDSDLTNDPVFITDFFKTISKNFDCVKASRYIAGGKMIDVPEYRQILSKIGNLFAAACFRLPIHDYTNGFRMIKRSVAERIPYTANDFSIILEEMFYLKKHNCSVFEIPTILTNRKASTSNFSYSVSLLFHYAHYALRAACI